MITAEKVFKVINLRGPCIPTDIKKVLGEGDTFIIGAVLTELRELGKIKVTNTKRGGSPFYYVPDQRSRLVSLVKELGEKDRRTAQRLQEHKFLRDKDEDPLVRVSLRQIKDFAVPVEVKLRDSQELFWKWYMTSQSEVEEGIKKMLGLQEPPKTPPPKAAAPEKPKEDSSPKRLAESSHAKKDEDQVILSANEPPTDDFQKKIEMYFSTNKISIISKKVIRKNSEVDYELIIPSAVGVVDYYCKAKSKKRCNDGDLSSAYLAGQQRRLPVLFLTTGEVTKKALSKMKTDFKGMVLQQLP